MHPARFKPLPDTIPSMSSACLFPGAVLTGALLAALLCAAPLVAGCSKDGRGFVGAGDGAVAGDFGDGAVIGDAGGGDAMATEGLNHPPYFTAPPSFSPGKNVFTCEPLFITAHAKDPDGDTLSYSWSIVSAPAGSLKELIPLVADPSQVLTQAQSFNYIQWHNIPGAQPIWGNKLGPGTTFKAARYVSVPADATAISGKITVSVDDLAWVRVNGVLISGGKTNGQFFHGPTTRDISKHLRPGQNRVAIDCKNNPSVGWLAARIELAYTVKGANKTATIFTDKSWTAENGETARFTARTEGTYLIRVTVTDPFGLARSLTFPVHVVRDDALCSK